MRDMDRQARKDKGAQRKQHRLDKACIHPRRRQPMREIVG